MSEEKSEVFVARVFSIFLANGWDSGAETRLEVIFMSVRIFLVYNCAQFEKVGLRPLGDHPLASSLTN